MPNFNLWTGSSDALSPWLDDVDRAYDTARHIADQSSSIAVIRAGVAQTAQTVRLEPLTTKQETVGAGGTLAVRQDMLVVGYRGHPTITNTDIRRGDRFYHEGQMWEVYDVLAETPERLLALARASGERRS